MKGRGTMVERGKTQRGAATVVAAGVLCVFACMAMGQTETEGGESPAEVLAELRAARDVRLERVREHRDWQAEQRRTTLLLEAVEQEAKRLESSTQAARARADALRDSLEETERQKARVDALRDVLKRRGGEIRERLADVSARTPPGLVPARTRADAAAPEDAFSADVQRLEQAYRRAGGRAIELVGGELDGRPLTVRLLRAGGVAGWWTSLDGARCGVAVQEGEALTLIAAAEAEEAEAIRRAFDVVAGRLAPDWVVLPFVEDDGS